VLPDGRVQLIEGNTSPPPGVGRGDGDADDGVYRRVRKAGIIGYIYPPYAPPAQKPVNLAALPGITFTTRRGDTLARIARHFRVPAMPGSTGAGTIQRRNGGIRDPLKPGTKLILPGVKAR